MASTYAYSGQHHSSQRGLAMVLALASAVVLSPLYVNKSNDHSHHYGHGFFESSRWSSGFVLPMVLAGLIIAIKTSSSVQRGSGDAVFFPSGDPSWVLRIGSSSWGLGAVLVLLVLVLSWQHSVQEFFWK